MLNNSRRPNSVRPLSATVSVNSTNNFGKSKNTVNPQRREKLKTLLIDKYCKKYGTSCTEELIRKEVNIFLDKESLTEKELKALDKKIENLVKNKESAVSLRENLKLNAPLTLDNLEMDSRFKINDNESISKYDKNKNDDDKLSVMSYSTRNSKFAKEIGFQNDDLLSTNKKPIERIEFNDKGEWEAIAEFNKQSYKESQILNKVKEKEKKKKTKMELTDQMQEKQYGKKNLRKEELEYGIVVGQHVKYLSEVEKLKELKEKEKILIEKKIRDEQLIENKKKRKTELKSQREYDIKVLKKIKEETEEEIKKNLQRKNEKHDELVATLKENEQHKIVLNERMMRQREEDIRAQNEYAAILDKQERDRAEFFKSKERKGNEFTSLMVENVIKEQEKKNGKLMETIEKYHKEKDRK